ncbi:DUF2510 domain-containing protein [Microbacterium sp.]|uniref:DUF2510 domain-containing protein n=1 Tax=Microbacterium sp. TaxID=51671 RepID=UPI003736EEE0
MDAPATTTPGWHPDPHLENTMRFWDGENWTAQTAPASGSAKSSVSSRKGVLIVFGGIMAALLVVLMFNWLTTPSAADCALQRVEVAAGDRATWELHDACR